MGPRTGFPSLQNRFTRPVRQTIGSSSSCGCHTETQEKTVRVRVTPQHDRQESDCRRDAFQTNRRVCVLTMASLPFRSTGVAKNPGNHNCMPEHGKVVLETTIKKYSWMQAYMCPNLGT